MTASHPINVKDLKQIDPNHHKVLFTLTGRVILGPDDPESINTKFGLTTIKQDLSLEDKTGKITFQVFGNMRKCSFTAKIVRKKFRTGHMYFTILHNPLFTITEGAMVYITNLKWKDYFGFAMGEVKVSS